MKIKANISSNIFKKIIYIILISLILLSNYRCNSVTFKREENSGGGSRWVFWTYENGERQCAYLCLLCVIILIIVLIICIFCIWYWFCRSKTSTIYERGSKAPLFMSKIPQIQIDYVEGDSNITRIDKQYEEAEKFIREFPPQEELPPLEHFDFIQSVGGAKAWQWIAEERMIADQIIAIIGEGKIIKFLKNMNFSIQTNYPCFVPVIGSEGINTQEDGQVSFSEEMFEQPQSMPHIMGQILHYYEITILENRNPSDTNISIGLATQPYPSFRLPGSNIYSVGYHSINGCKYNNNNTAMSYGPDWTEVGDTVGCGYNPTVGHVFFTKNGEFLGNAFTDIRHIWFPTIGASGPCVIKTNFGDDPERAFLYKEARGYGPGGPILLSKQRGLSKHRT
ncbi:16914_t:CDS:1 [Funneliformis mosseae]|uniref:16914_t:CDS:1 n=1 Tax=Funneliformis mosseae TaxID=27381 RepID=A0A9N8ZW97_FUNMO|nr:16914_t:CDS:1 [Funneliformis mosseae]